MRVSRVFIEQKINTGDIISLPADKAHHLAHVIRLRVGDKIRLFDNSEFEFEADIIEVAMKVVRAEVTSSSQLNNESIRYHFMSCSFARPAYGFFDTKGS